MNVFTGIGRLTKEPEISQTNSGMMIATYTLAIDRYSKDKDHPESDFLRCKCFGKTAEFAGRYLHKGKKIGVVLKCSYLYNYHHMHKHKLYNPCPRRWVQQYLKQHSYALLFWLLHLCKTHRKRYKCRFLHLQQGVLQVL